MTVIAKENQQRVGFLAAIPPLLRRLGVSPDDVLVDAGLKPDALDDPEKTIPYRAMGLLVRIAAERASCPDLGLKIGRYISTSTLGLVGELMQHAPNLGVALRDFANHQHRNARGGVVYLSQTADEAALGYAIYQPNVSGYDIICDGAVMGAFNLICELGNLKPSGFTRVLFAHSKPPDPTPYKQAFQVRLRFEADQNAVVFSKKLLDKTVVGASSKRRSEILEQIESVSHPGELGIEAKVRRELRKALLGGQSSLSEIAERLGTNRWTLERHLTASGSPFQMLLNESRCELTKQLLEHTSLSVGQISRIIGYAGPSVLTRAFTRWTGMTPKAWRNRGAGIVGENQLKEECGSPV